MDINEMAEAKLSLKQALDELKKEEPKKFVQSVNLIVNLRKFDTRKTTINAFVTLPHKIRDKKVCGFIEAKSSIINTIPKAAFINYKDKKPIKKLVKQFDFFVASAPLMPSVATTFGKFLGPAGKMPSPKLGILVSESESDIKTLVEKINHTVRIQSKEPSIKIVVGNEKMKEEDLIENLTAAYHAIVNELPNKKENVKSVMIKFAMTKPIRVEIH
jgi:large subunit ribosomal protein L1